MMFTGIVEEIGTVRCLLPGSLSVSLTIGIKKIAEDMHRGDSIAVNGVCLTVTDFSKTEFTADVMHETLNRSSLGKLKVGGGVNLERAMPANGRFGGHIVSGHIDGTGIIREIKKDGIAMRYTIDADGNILRYIVEKGSVAIDGISLTVAETGKSSFGVSVIPHTQGQTTLALKNIGDIVNLENDIIGKYVHRLLGLETAGKGGKITRDFLAEFGF